MNHEPTAVFSARVPHSLLSNVDQFLSDVGETRKSILVPCLKHMTAAKDARLIESLQRQLRAANILISDLQTRLIAERIPIPKKKAPKWKPLSCKSKRRLQVLHMMEKFGSDTYFRAHISDGMTTSEIACYTGMSANLAAVRCSELADEGYIERAKGEDGKPITRKSLESGNFLFVWRRTSKSIPVGCEI